MRGKKNTDLNNAPGKGLANKIVSIFFGIMVYYNYSDVTHIGHLH